MLTGGGEIKPCVVDIKSLYHFAVYVRDELSIVGIPSRRISYLAEISCALLVEDIEVSHHLFCLMLP